MSPDEKFLMLFESCTWPEKDWHHREHIKLAYIYLTLLPYDAAIQRMRSSLIAYNTAHNVPESLTRGYHETITLAWMHLVHLTLCEFGREKSADAFLDKHTQLLSRRTLLFFWSRDRIMSLEAKRQFVPPDLAPLPRSQAIKG